MTCDIDDYIKQFIQIRGATASSNHSYVAGTNGASSQADVYTARNRCKFNVFPQYHFLATYCTLWNIWININLFKSALLKFDTNVL